MAKVFMPDFEKRGGLVTVVVQDINSGEILMVAYTDQNGYLETLKTGELVLYSTSRKCRWKKGETSGNILKVHDVRIDCDGDTLVMKVNQRGSCACHTEARGCFYRTIFVNDALITPAPKAGEKEKLKEEDLEVHPSLLAGGR